MKMIRRPPSRATEAGGAASGESKDWTEQSNPIQKQYQPMQIHAWKYDIIQIEICEIQMGGIQIQIGEIHGNMI